jgi:predicted transcriptional regulator
MDSELAAQLKQATDSVDDAIRAHEISLAALAYAIASSLAAGMTVAQIANEVALPTATVTRLANKASMVEVAGSLHDITERFKATAETVEASKDARAELLTRLKNEGWPVNDLARQSGTSRLTVEKALSKAQKNSG